MPQVDVVVTGIGMVTPLGITAPATHEAWRSGASALRRRVPELEGSPLADAEVAPLPDYEAVTKTVPRRLLKYLAETGVLGCAAAHQATVDARVGERFRPERVGLYAATWLAASSILDAKRTIDASADEEGRFDAIRFGSRGMQLLNPLLSFKTLANMAACVISIAEGIRGPNIVFSPWEGQAGAALLEAWQAVAYGEVECALAGASAHAINPATVIYLKQKGLLAEGECPGAAAAYLVLEPAGSAERDGQRVYARIEGMSLVPADGGLAGRPLHGPGIEAVPDPSAAPSASVQDPLAERMGRTYAAAPAVLLGLACLEGAGETRIAGVDGWEFTAKVSRAAPDPGAGAAAGLPSPVSGRAEENRADTNHQGAAAAGLPSPVSGRAEGRRPQ